MPLLSYPVGTTTVVWTVTDVNGNTNTCSQTVTIVDNEVTSLTCPPDVVVNTTVDWTATGVVLGSPVVTDNGGVSTIVNMRHQCSLWDRQVTRTVTDDNGNVNTCTQNVTVLMKTIRWLYAKTLPFNWMDQVQLISQPVYRQRFHYDATLLRIL